jgi:hypothetical protein
VAARWQQLVLAGLASLLSPSADAADWKQQRYSADGFQIEFSGAVLVAETKMTPETQKLVVRSTNYMQDGGSYAYVATATLFKYGVNLEAGSAANFSTGKCKTKAETPIPLSGAEKGLEILGSDCSGDNRHYETRSFQKGKWFYQLVAIYSAGGDAGSARHFLHSFSLM